MRGRATLTKPPGRDSDIDSSGNAVAGIALVNVLNPKGEALPGAGERRVGQPRSNNSQLSLKGARFLNSDLTRDPSKLGAPTSVAFGAP